MAINPLFFNQYFKVERHNSTRPLCAIYAKQIEQMLNIYGQTIFYFNQSEYSFESISKLWGEDINKKYLEKYTLKGITEGENDNFTFNRFGVDKTSAERVIIISAKAFTEITGRASPLEGDMWLWQQNKIVYETTEVSNNEGLFWEWKLHGSLLEFLEWLKGNGSVRTMDRMLENK